MIKYQCFICDHFYCIIDNLSFYDRIHRLAVIFSCLINCISLLAYCLAPMGLFTIYYNNIISFFIIINTFSNFLNIYIYYLFLSSWFFFHYNICMLDNIIPWPNKISPVYKLLSYDMYLLCQTLLLIRFPARGHIHP